MATPSCFMKGADYAEEAREDKPLHQRLKLLPQQPVVHDDAVGVAFPGQRSMEKISARAFHDESARGDVPKAQSAFEVGIVAAARHVSEGQRSSAHQPHLAHAM